MAYRETKVRMQKAWNITLESSRSLLIDFKWNADILLSKLRLETAGLDL